MTSKQPFRPLIRTLPALAGAIVCLLATLAHADIPPPAHWKSLGIGGGGGLFSASISPHNPDNLYMSTDMSSVFRTTDFGRHWRTIDFRVLLGGHNSPIRFTADADILYSIRVPDDLDYGVPVKS